METWSEELRYDYPLNKDSIVFDIGGFEGTWAYNIHTKYLCNVLVFEPVKEFYNIIKSKFEEQDTIQIYNYGLGTKDETISIGVIGMSTSVFNKTGNNEQVEIKDILPILSRFTKIDLVKINIEGAEYDLLEYIIENGLQAKLVNIQIQFHNNITDHEKRRQAIRDELSKTHHLTYDFAYTHENWKLNEK
jgi:FkbM family methyltransferase